MGESDFDSVQEADSKTGNQECLVCFETVSAEESFRPECCGVVYHKLCWDRWNVESELCPTCRSFHRNPDMLDCVDCGARRKLGDFGYGMCNASWFCEDCWECWWLVLRHLCLDIDKNGVTFRILSNQQDRIHSQLGFRRRNFRSQRRQPTYVRFLPTTEEPYQPIASAFPLPTAVTPPVEWVPQRRRRFSAPPRDTASINPRIVPSPMTQLRCPFPCDAFSNNTQGAFTRNLCASGSGDVGMHFGTAFPNSVRSTMTPATIASNFEPEGQRVRIRLDESHETQKRELREPHEHRRRPRGARPHLSLQ